VAVGLDKGRFDTVHHDDTVGCQIVENLGHDFLEVAAVTADEDGIGRLNPSG
jgi:hypothetical protein